MGYIYVNSPLTPHQLEQGQLLRRSRLETYFEILNAIKEGAEKPTHIMYRANLSWVVLKQYFRALEEAGLLSSVPRKKKICYQLTDKGSEILNRFLAIREEMSEALDDLTCSYGQRQTLTTEKRANPDLFAFR